MKPGILTKKQRTQRSLLKKQGKQNKQKDLFNLMAYSFDFTFWVFSAVMLCAAISMYNTNMAVSPSSQKEVEEIMEDINLLPDYLHLPDLMGTICLWIIISYIVLRLICLLFRILTLSYVLLFVPYVPQPLGQLPPIPINHFNKRKNTPDGE